MIAQVPIQAANAAALIALGYTRIEVWHSGDQGATFQEITAHVAGPAVLASSAAQNTFRLGGRQLEFIINGGTLKTVTFSSMLVNWTPAQVRDQINTVVPSLASLDGSGLVVLLTTATTGRVSSINIIYNDGADLGWVAGQQVNGTDVRITLSGSTFYYLYSDVAGSPSDLYKWRFSADGVNPISVFSPPQQGNIPPLVANVAFATATFIDASGRPVVRTVIVVSSAIPTEVGSPPLIVGSETPLIFQSDANGFLQFPLVVGSVVRVAIDGSALVREFTVPGSPGSSFDLLTVMAAAPDPFTVQVPPPFLTRRSF